MLSDQLEIFGAQPDFENLHNKRLKGVVTGSQNHEIGKRGSLQFEC